MIELMVTISISSVLLVLILSSASQASRRAQAAKCTSNLREVGKAAILYAGDHGGTLPLAGDPGTGQNRWQEVLFEGGYIDDYRVTVCPSLLRKDSPLVPGTLPTANQGYGVRLWTNPDGFSWQMDAIRLTQIAEPSKWPYAADSVNMTGYGEAQQVCWLTSNTGSSTDNIVDLRHGGRANVVFADGHVASLGPEDLEAMDSVNGQSFKFGTDSTKR